MTPPGSGSPSALCAPAPRRRAPTRTSRSPRTSAGPSRSFNSSSATGWKSRSCRGRELVGRSLIEETYVGQGRFRFRVEQGWAKFPAGGADGEVVAVACDSADRVYVFARGPRPVLVFERDGTPVTTWGEGLFVRPHGLFVGPDDTVYCTDDFDHTVRAFTPEGRPLLTLGTSGRPSDTGATSTDYRTIRRAGPPFHYPTNLALGPAGDLYVPCAY